MLPFAVLTLIIANCILAESAHRRVYLGSEVTIQNYPYVVQIILKGPNSHFLQCGGSIIHPNLVLTASHCINPDIPITDYYVRAGTAYISGAGASSHKIAEVIYHPNPNSIEKWHHDIAMVVLSERIKFDGKRKNIQVADSTPASGTIGLVLGFGSIDNEQPVRGKTLRSAELSILSNADCIAKSNWDPSTLYDTTFCAAGLNHQATCQGDSGGPLVVADQLAGMVSIGHAQFCFKEGNPIIFTDINKYSYWIQNTAAKMKQKYNFQ